MRKFVNQAKSYLDHQAAQANNFSGKLPAIVLDVDDTTLNTYIVRDLQQLRLQPDHERGIRQRRRLPGRVLHAGPRPACGDDGYTVFYLTGRPESQRAGTVSNLVNDGLHRARCRPPVHAQQGPAPATCLRRQRRRTAPPTQYKSMTREHIESLGYDIVGQLRRPVQRPVARHAAVVQVAQPDVLPA